MNTFKKSIITSVLFFAVLPIMVGAATQTEEELRQKLIQQIIQLQAAIAALQNTSTSALNLTTNLWQGTKGAEVTKLQQFLKSTGDFTYPEITGYYGPVTTEAVKRYQCRVLSICSGTPDSNGYGVVGPKTRIALSTHKGGTVTSGGNVTVSGGSGEGGGGGGSVGTGTDNPPSSLPDQPVIPDEVSTTADIVIDSYSVSQFNNQFGVGADEDMGVPSGGTTYTVSSKEDLRSLLNSDDIESGDKIVVKNGNYSNWGTFVWPEQLSGDSSKQIYFIPETQGGVTFSGDFALQIWARDVFVGGFIFEDITVSNSVYQNNNRLIWAPRYYSSGIRVAYNKFENIGTTDGGIVTTLFFFGDNIEIDHNDFTKIKGMTVLIGQTQRSTYVSGSNPVNPWIHHNKFYNITQVASNGGEPIALGYGHNYPASEFDNYINGIVEYNSFDEVVGDSEIISLKSSGNKVRNNYIANSTTKHINVRYGDNNLIQGNWITDAQVGFRISGYGNRIIYNYVEMSENSENIFAYMTHQLWDGLADPNPTYPAADSNLIAYNIVVRPDKFVYLLQPPSTPALEIQGLIKDNRIFKNIILVKSEEAYVPFTDNSNRYSSSEFGEKNTYNNNFMGKTAGEVYEVDNSVPSNFFDSITGSKPYWYKKITLPN